ncbi:MAG TPA: 50S ribosomal protein L6 [Actinomycetota bacterium]|nr:50S ribosomal protein L6 [Actinomycetota bacterium]
MSRIGKQPIAIPEGVDVEVTDGLVTVKGPGGELSQRVDRDMKVTVEDGEVKVERPSDEREHRSLHGLTRSLIANMVEGVTKGFEKRLEIQGVGYRAALKGADLELQVGFSHPVTMTPPAGIEFEVPAPNRIVIRGIDKQLVGEVAANVRKVRKPEPYKGKGIRYEGEYVRKKAGKAAKGAVA